MLKLVVLLTLLNVALVRGGFYEPILHAAPAYASVAIEEPAYAHVGSIVKSVPSAVSHQSQSVVHSSAHVVEDVYAPAVKSISYTTKSLVAPPVNTHVAPAYLKTVAAPVVYKPYDAESPLLYQAW